MGIKQIIDDSKSRLDALLTYANGVTGADDVNIGDAVKRLADGFGGGAAVKVDMGSITLSSNTKNVAYPINHSLGAVPKMVCFWAVDSPQTLVTQGSLGGIVMSEPSQWSYANGVTRTGSSVYTQVNGTISRVGISDDNITNFNIAYWTTDTITLPCFNNNNILYGGVTYKWLCATWD